MPASEKGEGHGRTAARDQPAAQGDPCGAGRARQGGAQARAAPLARARGSPSRPAGPGRPARGAGGRPGPGPGAHPLRAHARLARHLLPGRRAAHGVGPGRDARLRAHGPAVRRRPPHELRPLPVARAKPRLRHQRLRRDAAGAVGVGRQAPRRELRDRGARPRLRRAHATVDRPALRARLSRGDAGDGREARHRPLVHAPRRRPHQGPRQRRWEARTRSGCPRTCRARR